MLLQKRADTRGVLFIPATITYVLGPPPSRGGDLKLEGGVNVSLYSRYEEIYIPPYNHTH